MSTTTSPTARRSCARSPTTGSSTTRCSTPARTRARRRSTPTPPNNLHFYVIDKYTDARGILHYVVGVQNPTGAGPADARRLAGHAEPATRCSSCTFQLTNTGVDAATDPALHPQDETASLHNDIYRLSAVGLGRRAGRRDAAQRAGDREVRRAASTCRSTSRTPRRAEPRQHGHADRDLGERPVQDRHGDLRATPTDGDVGGIGAGDAVADARRSGQFGAFQPGVARTTPPRPRPRSPRPRATRR